MMARCLIFSANYYEEQFNNYNIYWGEIFNDYRLAIVTERCFIFIGKFFQQKPVINYTLLFSSALFFW